jgi:hypothetical protein
MTLTGCTGVSVVYLPPYSPIVLIAATVPASYAICWMQCRNLPKNAVKPLPLGMGSMSMLVNLNLTI